MQILSETYRDERIDMEYAGILVILASKQDINQRKETLSHLYALTEKTDDVLIHIIYATQLSIITNDAWSATKGKAPQTCKIPAPTLEQEIEEVLYALDLLSAFANQHKNNAIIALVYGTGLAKLAQMRGAIDIQDTVDRLHMFSECYTDCVEMQKIYMRISKMVSDAVNMSKDE